MACWPGRLPSSPWGSGSSPSQGGSSPGSGTARHRRGQVVDEGRWMGSGEVRLGQVRSGEVRLAEVVELMR